MKVKLIKHICLFILSLLLFSGCTADTAETPEDTTAISDSGQMLNLSLIADTAFQERILTSEELGGNFNYGLYYSDVSDVQISIHESIIPLEDALRDGLVTEEELFCYVRMDARNGFCEEQSQSSHGLSHFTYVYPNFSVRLIYDLYETPDGQQHRISHMRIYAGSTEYGAYTNFTGTDQSLLDRENWGLSLSVQEVSPAGLTFVCDSAEGQQLGDLSFDGYVLTDGEVFIPNLDNTPYVTDYTQPVIKGSNTYLLDWADIYGELAPGDYEMWLYVTDNYEESALHPLMENYHDTQIYVLPFSIAQDHSVS